MIELSYRQCDWSAKPLNPASHNDTQIFSARLSPHRSLQRRQFHFLMMFLCGAMFFISIPFFVLGAWPVLGFMGLDVLGFWWAFRINYRDARAYEDIRLSHFELSVDRVSAKGKRDEWRFNPAWVRIVRQEHEEFGLEKLWIVFRDRSVELASFLGPDQKADFARDFALALSEAKRGPRYS
jgi:uncharacterized membrane protein